MSKFFLWLTVFADKFRDKHWIKQAQQLFATAIFDKSKDFIDCQNPGIISVVFGQKFSIDEKLSLDGKSKIFYC